MLFSPEWTEQTDAITNSQQSLDLTDFPDSSESLILEMSKIFEGEIFFICRRQEIYICNIVNHSQE